MFVLFTSTYDIIATKTTALEEYTVSLCSTLRADKV